MKLSFNTVVLAAFAVATTSAVSLRGNRVLQVVYPECGDTNPSTSLLTGAFSSSDEAYGYCVGECGDSDDLCQAWRTNFDASATEATEATEAVAYPECGDSNPSQSVLTGAFSSANEAVDYCTGECGDTPQFCRDWRLIYNRGSRDLLIIWPWNQALPDCGDEDPSTSVLTGVFSSSEDAYEYCVEECGDSDALCQVWITNYDGGDATDEEATTHFPDCGDETPAQSVLIGAFASGAEAVDYCQGECGDSAEFCSAWLEIFEFGNN